ncbi:MAG: FtsW/RodA/SpoVE family cell cycle protein, partial [Oscillospiraceae bacterium]
MKKLFPYVKDFFKRADMLLFTLCFISSIFGIIVIASATHSLPEGSTRYLLVQVASMFIGIGLFVVFTVIDLDIIADKWAAIIVFELFMMLLLLTPLGYADNTGNRAWLRFGFVGVQPAEVVKVAFIVVMSKHISYLKNYKSLSSPLSVAQLVFHLMFILGIIVVISKDMGSALVFLFIFIVML